VKIKNGNPMFKIKKISGSNNLHESSDFKYKSNYGSVMLRNINLLSLVSVPIYSSFFDYNGLFAQSVWLNRNHAKTISLEILKPNFERKDFTTFTTSTLFLSGRFAGTNKISVVSEVPFSHYDIESFDVESESAIGNHYLGIEI
jgi:hypothetical protein